MQWNEVLPSVSMTRFWLYHRYKEMLEALLPNRAELDDQLNFWKHFLSDKWKSKQVSEMDRKGHFSFPSHHFQNSIVFSEPHSYVVIESDYAQLPLFQRRQGAPFVEVTGSLSSSVEPFLSVWFFSSDTSFRWHIYLYLRMLPLHSFCYVSVQSVSISISKWLFSSSDTGYEKILMSRVIDQKKSIGENRKKSSVSFQSCFPSPHRNGWLWSG